MATTSLKLPDELKTRAAAVARMRGVTPHAFMVEAVDQATTAAEQRARFIQDALDAREDIRRGGKVYDGREVLAYYRAKSQGKPARKPKPFTWRG